MHVTRAFSAKIPEKEVLSRAISRRRFRVVNVKRKRYTINSEESAVFLDVSGVENARKNS